MMRKTIRILLVTGLFLGLASYAPVKAQNGSIDGYFSSGGTSVNGSGSLVGSIGEPVVGLLHQDWQHFLQGFAYKTLEHDIVTSVSDIIDLQVQVKLFPNPVEEYLTIRYDGYMTGNEKYMIYDDGGRLVRSGLLIDQSTQINVDALRPGVYIFYLINKSNNQRISFNKFVKFN